MEQLALNIKHEDKTGSPWGFDNFDWLTGNKDNMILFFFKAIPRLEKLAAEDPQNKNRIEALIADCRKRLNEIKANSKNN